MGLDISATTVVGIILNKNLHVNKRVKAFPHEWPDDWLVDPKTKMPLWKDELVLVPGVIENGVGGYQIGPWDVFEEQKSDTQILGRKICEVDEKIRLSSCNIKPSGGHLFFDVYGKESIQRHQEEMKKLLEPFGFWTDTFGIHTILSFSY